MYLYIISSLAILVMALHHRTPVVEEVDITEEVIITEEMAEVPESAVIAETETFDSLHHMSGNSTLSTSTTIDPVRILVPPGPSSTDTTHVSPSPKRGLAYNDISLLPGLLGLESQAIWCYNWASRPGGTVPTGLEYVPMLWGLSSSMTSTWDSSVMEALHSGPAHLLSFNEPDLGPPNPQSNLDFNEAARGYYQFMEKYAGKARLGSPSVTNGDPASGMGLGWLTKFLGACKTLGCTIDFVAVHWYGYDSTSDVENFKDHITQAYAAGGHRPVWITEFRASGDTVKQQAFLEAVIPWLDAQNFVERYAYFMVSDGSLISGDNVSALGRTFAFLSQ